MKLSQYLSLVDFQARMALKSDASNYFLGYLWWVLEPLLFVLVFYLVFDVFLDSGRADFLIFLVCGKLPFVWFSKSVSQASNSIVANAGMIGRIDVPKSLFPMAIIQEGLYKQAVVFLLLFIILNLQGYPVSGSWLWLIPIVVVNYLMIVGCAFFGSILVCFMKDFAMLIPLGMLFLMFMSGIFWDVRSIADPQLAEALFTYNPMAFILDSYRQALMFESSPDLMGLLRVGLVSTALIAVMVWYMRKYNEFLALRALTV